MLIQLASVKELVWLWAGEGRLNREPAATISAEMRSRMRFVFMIRAGRGFLRTIIVCVLSDFAAEEEDEAEAEEDRQYGKKCLAFGKGRKATEEILPESGKAETCRKISTDYELD